jgi:hypothetical protein
VERAPFFELQHHQVRGSQGGLLATDLVGGTSFWAPSFGARLFFGGDSYGVLDSMTEMTRTGAVHVH